MAKLFVVLVVLCSLVMLGSCLNPVSGILAKMLNVKDADLKIGSGMDCVSCTIGMYKNPEMRSLVVQ